MPHTKLERHAPLHWLCHYCCASGALHTTHSCRHTRRRQQQRRWKMHSWLGKLMEKAGAVLVARLGAVRFTTAAQSQTFGRTAAAGASS